MNKFIATCTCLFFLLLSIALAENKIEEKYEVTNVKSFLNVRSGPGTIYSILRALPNTEKNIIIIKSKQLAKSTWVKIKHNDEYGWVNKVYLKMSETTHDNIYNNDNHHLWLSMTGVYSLTNIAPTKGENMDTHMLFQLESKQAKILYNAIKTSPFIDKCTGAIAKKIGEMLCLYYPPQQKTIEVVKSTINEKSITEIYECHFSLNIMKQKIQQGIPCEE